VEHPHRIAILVIVVSLSLICPSAHGGIAPHWTADYRVLFDGTDYFGAGQDFVIASAALSADGSTAAIGGYHANDSTWFVIVMPTNGGPGTTVALPVDPHPDRPTMRIQNLCLDSDGSRVFVITPWYQYRIYRIESGTATEVVNYTDYAYLSMPTDGIVRTTSTGEWVYFNEDRDDLYRVAHTGGVPERVLDDASITTSDGHTGWAIGDFEISSDGASAAFIMSGYTTKSPAAVVRYDAYSLVSGTVHQLTLDSTSEGHVAMSDDGSTVAFKGAGGWTAAAADGSDTRALIGASHNVAGCDLSGDGSALVYSDANANGGRLVPTDGSGELDIFPDWSPVFLAAVYNFQISSDGSVVGFGSTTRKYYVGRLNHADMTFPGPSISGVTLDPPYLNVSNPTSATLTLDVSHSGGQPAIQAVSADPMANGHNTADWADRILSIPFAPDDDGVVPDAVAGDGIYSTNCDPAGAADTPGTQRIRTSAEDTDGNVRVVDVLYLACASGGCPIMDGDFEDGGFADWSSVVGN
jgi:hypothetical protein